MTGRSNGSEKREGGGVGQEGRDAGGRWDTELEDAGYAYVEQVSFSRLKNKKKQKKELNIILQLMADVKNGL